MEILLAAIGCTGSIIAALIGAIGSILAARMGKEEAREKIDQNRVTQEVPILFGYPQENYQGERSKSKVILERGSQKDKAGVFLGYSAIFCGFILSCISIIFLFPLIFTIPAIIYGIIAVVTGKRWAGVSGMVLNGLAIIMIILIALLTLLPLWQSG